MIVFFTTETSAKTSENINDALETIARDALIMSVNRECLYPKVESSTTLMFGLLHSGTHSEITDSERIEAQRKLRYIVVVVTVLNGCRNRINLTVDCEMFHPNDSCYLSKIHGTKASVKKI